MRMHPRHHRPRRGLAALLALLLAPGVGAADAWFTAIEYRGDDGGPVPAAGQFRNPVLAGFYPDPSAIRVGEDFYLVTSSFGYYPACRCSTAPTWCRGGRSATPSTAPGRCPMAMAKP